MKLEDLPHADKISLILQAVEERACGRRTERQVDEFLSLILAESTESAAAWYEFSTDHFGCHYEPCQISHWDAFTDKCLDFILSNTNGPRYDAIMATIKNAWDVYHVAREEGMDAAMLFKLTHA